MKKKQTKEELLIELVKSQEDQMSLLVDIMSDLAGVDVGEVKIFRKRLKYNLKLIKKL